MTTLPQTAIDLQRQILRDIDRAIGEAEDTIGMETRLDDEIFGLGRKREDLGSVDDMLKGKYFPIPDSVYESAQKFGDIVNYILQQA